jgi:hypothetical protein
MARFLLLVFFAWGAMAGTPGITRIGPGSATQYSVGRILPSPMSDPQSVMAQFNIPDTLDVTLSIISGAGDTLLCKTYEALPSGEYKFAWVYGELPPRSLGRALFVLSACGKKDVIFSCALRFLLI